MYKRQVNLVSFGTPGNVMSGWDNPLHGLEALGNPRNWCLGLAVLFLARTMASLFFVNRLDHDVLHARSRKYTLYNGVPFVAVSYTHLDVYKRQERGLLAHKALADFQKAKSEGRDADAADFETIIKAVSYTHLNFDLSPGYAGVENPLYTRKSGVHLMLGDAKESLSEMLGWLK